MMRWLVSFGAAGGQHPAGSAQRERDVLEAVDESVACKRQHRCNRPTSIFTFGREQVLLESVPMALHPHFPTSPYAPLIPDQRWFPADETLRATAYEKLLPPLVAKVRREVYAWRNGGYAGASPTSAALLRLWFDTEHLTETADGSLSTFNYYFAQREAVETVIWLYEVKKARDKFDLLRFDASGAVSSGMFAEDYPLAP